MNQTIDNTNHSRAGVPASSTFARASLLAAAVVLGTLVATQIVRLVAARGVEPTALAGIVSDIGGVTILTAEANNEDLVFVLDGRSEELTVYKPESNGTLDLLQKYPVPELFQAAKSRAGVP